MQPEFRIIVSYESHFTIVLMLNLASQMSLLLANEGDGRDLGSTPGRKRSPGGEHGNPLQYSCLENPMDRGAWRATIHGVANSQTLFS